MKQIEKRAFLELHISILLAGCTGLFGRLITLNEGLLTFWRLFFTVVFIAFYLFIIKKLKKINLKDFLSFFCYQLQLILFVF